MLKVRYSSQFKKDVKLAQKRHLPLDELKIVIQQLANEEQLDEKYRDHALTGKYTSFRECHVHLDWLLIYRIEDGCCTLIAQRTGTHSDLFGL